MKATEIDYEVDDRVRREVYGETEYGVVKAIPDGEEIGYVAVVTEDDDAYGIYYPGDWRKA